MNINPVKYNDIKPSQPQDKSKDDIAAGNNSIDWDEVEFEIRNKFGMVTPVKEDKNKKRNEWIG